MALIRNLPLFPLGLVLYPRERLPLHIFEPRYKEMIAFCEEGNHPFGIVFFDEGKMARMGCTARITRILDRYEDGRLDLLVTGEARFLVETISEDLDYLTADVELVPEPAESPPQEEIERVITQHMRLLELAGRTVRPSLYENEPSLSYVIAPNAGLTPQQQQNVLEMRSESQRIDFLISHLETLIPHVEKMEDLRQKIQSNGHFKDFPPEEPDSQNDSL
ncbi:MAG TPA: LON peptidase substrate-binding domain-containing protein [Rhodothermales bacterium]|nr:LON peptidase substrate-binding domain-containing protein [Rhodothermales bacterium]